MTELTKTYVTLVDNEISSTYEMAKCKLLNMVETQLGKHYMINFSKESIDKHAHVIDAILDQFRREDGEYSYRGNLVDYAKLVAIVKERYYALVLTCVTMETVPASYKVLEFGEVES